MRNMKIPVENNLDEIVAELERLGYESNGGQEPDDKAVIAINGSFFGWWSHDNWTIPLTTLAELKEMQNAK